MRNAPGQFAIACSHQDQVITAPAEAELLLASPFTPNAGLVYRNGAALSLQAHPEFSDDYSIALTELRRGTVPEEVVETALNSMDRPSNSRELAHSIGQFFKGR